MRRTRLHKQIRKRLLDRDQDFFVICPPGFEAECANEIQALSHSPLTLTTERGGLTFKAALPIVPELNLTLRTASRILMRIGHFTAREFHQLEKAAAEIPWPLYFPKGPSPEIRVSCQHCRLYHTEAIAQRIRNIFETKMMAADGAPFRSEWPLPTLYIRGEKDRFILSIDSSGPHLHLRGLKTQGGKAPLRETLAAAVLMASGYKRERCLVDPMCGSGTFSMEAALMATGIPPGSFRNFAWKNWPAFLNENKKEETFKGSPLLPLSPILASDRDTDTVQRLRTHCQTHPALQCVTVSQADFFSLSPPDTPPGLVVLNPPYGLRMLQKTEADSLTHAIQNRLSKKWRGWQTGLILPETSGVASIPGLQRRGFLHGGLNMYLFTGRIP